MNDLSAVPIDLENYRYADGGDINGGASPNAVAAAVFLYGKDANGRWVFFLGQNDFGRPKLWTVPGGTVEHGLNSSATAAQELYEETAGYQGFHPGIYENIEAVKAAPVYKYVNEQGKIVDIYFIDLNEMGMLQKNMTDVLQEIAADGKFRERAVEITKKVGAKYREDRTGRITSAYTEKFRWAAVPFEDLCQFLLKSPTGPRDFSAYEIMINGRKNSIRDVDAKSLRAFFNKPAHEIAKYLPPEPMNILLSCKGHVSPQRPVSPRAVSPRPVSPRPVSPLPVSPRAMSPRQVSPPPVSPRPVSPRAMSPRPVSQLPVTQVQPVIPRPLIPRPVSQLPVTQVQPVIPRPVSQLPVTQVQPVIPRPVIPLPVTQVQPVIPRPVIPLPVTQVQQVSPRPLIPRPVSQLPVTQVQPVIPRLVTQVQPVSPRPVIQVRPVRPVSPVLPLSPPREESPPQAQYLPATGRPLFQVPFPAPLPSQTGRPAGPTPTEISRARGFDIFAAYRPETE